MKLNDPLNTVPLPGHKGPHSAEYHTAVFAFLTNAVKNLKAGTAEYEIALKSALWKLRVLIVTPGTWWNAQATTPG
jgi:hypothetical protein